MKTQMFCASLMAVIFFTGGQALGKASMKGRGLDLDSGAGSIGAILDPQFIVKDAVGGREQAFLEKTRKGLKKFDCIDPDGGPNNKIKGSTYYLVYDPVTKADVWHKVTDRCKADDGLQIVYEGTCQNYQSKLNKVNETDILIPITCALGEICQDGMCVPDPCKDSDSGLNLSVAGNVVTNTDGKQETKFDKCISGAVLSETVCNNGDNEETVNCCDMGMICENGACVVPTPDKAGMCYALSDLCPEVEGMQTEYLFDHDMDGQNDDCMPVGQDFCQEPDPAGVYPGGTLYEHENGLHIGFCLEGNKIFHVVCSDSGQLNTDITECENGLPCQNGMCSSCFDPDGGENYEQFGTVQWIKPSGDLLSVSDSCSPSGAAKQEGSCKDGQLATTFEQCQPGTYCQEHWDAGVIKISCLPPALTPSCTDTDGPDNFYDSGEVMGVGLNGLSFSISDTCASQEEPFASYILDYGCTEDHTWYVKNLKCEAGKHCQKYTEDGKIKFGCLDPAPSASCMDSDGGITAEQYGYVEGYDNDGNFYHENDNCNGDNSGIKEYFCSGKTPDHQTIKCEAGKFCKIYQLNGQTKVGCESLCFKAGDPNDDIFTAGVVYDSFNSSYPDFCDGDVLRQFGCDQSTGDKVDIPAFTCPNGCQNGACILGG